MSTTAATGPCGMSLRGLVSDAEWRTRVDLAAGCRLAHSFGWNHTILNHLTARVPGEPDRFLMNPLGLLWNEITASDFLKVDFDGHCHTPSDYRPGPAGLSFHGAVLKADPRLASSFHLHPLAGVVVSALESGLIYYSQDSLMIYEEVVYHDFEGPADEADEGQRVARELDGKLCMIMRNHGLLTVGRDIAEAFYAMQVLVEACEVQARVMSTGAAARPVPLDVCELSARKFRERRRERPFGEAAWKANRRMIERLDPSFMT